MLDIKFIRSHPQVVKEALNKRKETVDIDGLLALDKENRTPISEVE